MTHPVGPRNTRPYPDAKPTTPGHIALDGRGPWTIGADKLYLTTVQDRFPRLTAAVPSASPGHNRPAEGLQASDGRSWAVAMAVAREYLLPGRLSNVRCDNGVGMIPAFGTLPIATRFALALGAIVTFIPPAQPWRNGRLERFHWTPEREYFRSRRPDSIKAALTGLTNYLNCCNTTRPHTAAGHQPPARNHQWFSPLPPDFWRRVDTPELRLPVPGTVECVRLVYTTGLVDVWGHLIRLQPDLAGHYARVIFNVTGALADGRVTWEETKQSNVEVARFRHYLDARGHGGSQFKLFHSVEWVGTPYADADSMDMEQLANQQSRVLKQRSGLERARSRGDRMSAANPGQRGPTPSES